MKNRILTNWTLTRVLFLLMGTTIIIQAIINKEWFGMVLGAYFATMGLFAVGCASGNCFADNNKTAPTKPSGAEDIQFEEVK